MFDIFKKNKNSEVENTSVISIACLLIHAARIDQNYSAKEKTILKKTLLKLGINDLNVDKIIEEAEIIEQNSNQILEFTKEVKNMDNDSKIKIIENLWRIIYSNNEADVYETSLMRRLAGLLYVDNITMGDIKNKIKKEYSQ